MGIGAINLDVGGILNGLGRVGKLVKDVRAAITGKEVLDPNKEAELQAKLLEIEGELNKAQTDINLAEASHPSIFVAGWRPWIGWVCGVALAWHFVASPMVVWIAGMLGKTVAPPILEMGILVNIVMAMLGLGGLRTFEKYKNCEKNR